MINRGVTKTSQYFFNPKTGVLEKNDKNVQTIESLSKQANKNLDDLGKAVNYKKSNEPINNITVITVEDNLIHNYFTSMDISWDASNCLSSAIIKAPKMDVENTNYWTTYTGQLTVYAGYNFTFDYVNNNSHSTEKDAADSLTKYWDNSDITPFFKGEVSRVKEMENDIVIYVDSIGKRFQQKIPDEFRQAFIYNQNVRDAFQAICEFLGVTYICPPQTATDDGETEGTDEEVSTDGTENDINKQQSKEQQVKQIAQNKVNQSNSSSSPSSDPSDPNNQNSDTNMDDTSLTNNEEIDTPQNGYSDINFDANGAITHGSTVIETSPDMAETLVAMEENPLEKYLEDETGIVEKVQKFLDGDMFDELHNKVMDYGAITIEPKASSTSDMSTMPGANGATTNGSNSSSSTGKNGWHDGQLYENGKIVLYDSYINTLLPAQARAKAEGGANTYTQDTLDRLWRRANSVVVSWM